MTTDAAGFEAWKCECGAINESRRSFCHDCGISYYCIDINDLAFLETPEEVENYPEPLGECTRGKRTNSVRKRQGSSSEDDEEDDDHKGFGGLWGGLAGSKNSKQGSGYNGRGRGSWSSQEEGSWGSDHTVQKLRNLDQETQNELIELSDSIEGYNLTLQVQPIKLSFDVYRKLLVASQEIPNVEFSAMLNEHDGIVDEVYFPEQRGSSANVTDIDHEDTAGYDGFYHSHHNMGATFSGTDHDGHVSNYDIAIVGAWQNKPNSLKFGGTRRIYHDEESIIYAECEVKKVHDLRPYEDFRERVNERHTTVSHRPRNSKKKSKGNNKNGYGHGHNRSRNRGGRRSGHSKK